MSGQDSAYALVDELLPDTVRLAASQSGFYRDKFRGLDLSCVTRAKLATFPVVGKDELIAAGLSRLDESVPSFALANTSGSTGKFFLIHRSRAEEQFISDFFARLAARQAHGDPPVVFSLSLPSHGTPVAIPANVFLINHCIIDDRTARNFVCYLSSGEINSQLPNSPRVIHGALTQVLLLTKYCVGAGIPPQDFKIGEIVVSGEHLSARMYNFLAQTWNARIVNRYSLSEVFGGATCVDGSRRFYFDPYVYPEIVNCGSSAAGELVLTSLYPFVQKQPMIRYRTLDIFEKIGATEFQQMGRKNHCLHADGDWILFGSDLYDIVDEEPLLARESHALGVTANDHEATGKPIVEGRYGGKSNGRHLIRLKFGTRGDLTYFPSHFRKLRERLTEAILAACRAPAEVDIEFGIRIGKATSAYEKGGMVWQYEA